MVGGVFNHPLCFNFLLAVHKQSRAHLADIEMLAMGRPREMATLLKRVRNWDREMLIKETEVWLAACPNLLGLYQFTVVQTIKAYVELYPSMKAMGVRIPGLTDFIFSFILTLFEDPRVKAGKFTSSDHARTFGIVVERLGSTMAQAVTDIYFPRYSSATSIFAKHEPNMQGLQTPAGTGAVAEDWEVEVEAERVLSTTTPQQREILFGAESVERKVASEENDRY